MRLILYTFFLKVVYIISIVKKLVRESIRWICCLLCVFVLRLLMVAAVAVVAVVAGDCSCVDDISGGLLFLFDLNLLNVGVLQPRRLLTTFPRVI